MEHRADSRPARSHGDRHRRQQRPRAGERPRAGASRRERGARLPQHGQGRERATRDRGGRAGRARRGLRARPRQPGVGAVLRRALPLDPRRPRPADQQRRSDGAPARGDGGRVRVAAGDEPSRPLRADRPADRRDGGPCGRARGLPVEHRAQNGADQIRRPPVRAPVQPLARLRPVQARRPDERARARPAVARRSARRSRAWPPTRATPPPTCRAPRRRSWIGWS